MRRARQTGRTRLRRQRGLTLIEVLVALAIAVALAAALRATGLMAANNRALQDKALALIAAQNALVLLRLEQTLPRPARALNPVRKADCGWSASWSSPIP